MFAEGQHLDSRVNPLSTFHPFSLWSHFYSAQCQHHRTVNILCTVLDEINNILIVMLLLEPYQYSNLFQIFVLQVVQEALTSPLCGVIKIKSVFGGSCKLSH